MTREMEQLAVGLAELERESEEHHRAWHTAHEAWHAQHQELWSSKKESLLARALHRLLHFFWIPRIPTNSKSR